MVVTRWSCLLGLLGIAGCTVQGAQPPVQAGTGLQDSKGTLSVNPSDVPVLMNCAIGQVVAKGSNGWECATPAQPLPDCADGQYLVHQNGAWTCGGAPGGGGIAPPAQACAANEVLSWNGTALTCVTLPAAPVPPPSAPCEPNQFVTWNGTAWACADLPAMPTPMLPPTACGTGQYVTWDGSALTCASLPAAVPPPAMACGLGQFATWTGMAWQCASLPPSAPSPMMSCGPNQYTTWNGSVWGCADLPASPPAAACGSSQYATWTGTTWTCANLPSAAAPPTSACRTGQYLSWNGSALACVNLPTSAPPPSSQCGASQFVIWTGTAWLCASLPPSAPLPGNSCGANQYATWNGSAWACANLPPSAVMPSSACSASQYVTWNGSAWACVNLPTTAGPPTSACSSGEFITWTGSAWQCNALPPSAPVPSMTCSSGQFITWNGSGWACADAPSSSLPMSCAYGDAPYWDGSQWLCSSTAAAEPAGTCAGAVAPKVQAGPDTGMMLVPAGPFWRGCNSAIDTNCGTNESPGKCIDISGFEIDQTEVTMSAYQNCVAAGACPAPPATDMNGWACNYSPSSSGTPNFPVLCVSWDNAKAYCQWAGKRLPTAAEWEKAARGVDGRLYPWGNQAPTCQLTNGAAAAGGAQCNTFALNVGTFMSGDSPYGLYDAAGNAWEWVNDWYDGTYYSSAPLQDPQGPATSTASKEYKGGGILLNGPGHLRPSGRNYMSNTSIESWMGFRCAKSVP